MFQSQKFVPICYLPPLREIRLFCQSNILQFIQHLESASPLEGPLALEN